jgi:hypothetical protein
MASRREVGDARSMARMRRGLAWVVVGVLVVMLVATLVVDGAA